MRALVSSTDIAELCKVTKSAVSNWKYRYNDFPEPVIQNRQTTLYDLNEMTEFLKKRGKISG